MIFLNMKTLKFQVIFYFVIGLCIVINVLSFKSFDFIETDTAMSWTIKYFGLPILIVLIPICSFIYLRYLIQYEKKNFRSNSLMIGRTIFRIFVLTLGMAFIFLITTFSTIILTNGYIGRSKTVDINAIVIDYKITGEGVKKGITKHYIKIKDEQINRIIELKVDKAYKIGQPFTKTMKVGIWGLLYSEK